MGKPIAIFFGVLIFSFLFTYQVLGQSNESTIWTCVGPCPTATPTATPSVTPTPTSSTAPTATPDATVTATPTGSPSSTATPTGSPISSPYGSGTPFPSGTPKPPFAPNELIIYGYGPANSSFYLMGIAVYEVTKSDDKGYFVFNRLMFPTILSYASDLLFPELCIQAVDENNLVTQPSCIPAMPLNMSVQEVGPILVSPTLTIDKNIFYQDEFIQSMGKTIPNSKVFVTIIRQEKSFIPKIISQVSAYSIPHYEVTSDAEGNYSFNLPSNTLDNWKIFASTEYGENTTPASNTLHFRIKPQIYQATETYETIKKYITGDVYIAIAVIEILLIVALCILYYKRFKVGTLTHKYKVKVAKRRKHIKLSELQREYLKLQGEYIHLLKKKGVME